MSEALVAARTRGAATEADGTLATPDADVTAWGAGPRLASPLVLVWGTRIPW